MKLALAILVLFASVALAQPLTVRGKVIDKATKEPVAGAIVASGSELAATEDEVGESREMTMLRGADLQEALIDEGALPTIDPDELAGPFAHIVVDEAQELSDAEWRMLVRRCPSRSLTIVDSRLRRIVAPQGVFVHPSKGDWKRGGEGLKLHGGQGSALRADHHRPGKLGIGTDDGSEDRHLKAITALIDPRQFALLTKPERRRVELSPRYVGFEIPDRFVVGYGLDYAERFRNLPYVAVLNT